MFFQKNKGLVSSIFLLEIVVQFLFVKLKMDFLNFPFGAIKTRKLLASQKSLVYKIVF